MGDRGPGRAAAFVAAAALTASLGAFAGPAQAAPGATISGSEKAGAALWESPGATRMMRRSGAAWYHSWTSEPPAYLGRSRARFVPMMWGSGSVTEDSLAAASRQGRWLMGFNEPDLDGQADLSVEQALDLWPRLEGTGQRLVSPAVAWGGADEGGWLDRFMTGAEERGLRVDAVAVHWYGGDWRPRAARGQLMAYLDAVRARYGKPVWLTEFALMRFDGGGQQVPRPRVQARFLTLAARGMQRRAWLKRWAWFGLPAPARGRSTGLVRPEGTPTAAGRAFRQIAR